MDAAVTGEREVPHSDDAERAVLGICLYRPDAVRVAGAIVRPGDFYRPKHAAAFAAMLDLDDRAVAVDPTAVAVALEASSTPFALVDLAAMASEAPSVSNVTHFARVVAERAAQRRLLAIAADLTDAAYGLDDPAESIDRTTASMAKVLLPDTSGLPPLAMSADEWLVRTRDEQTTPWVIPGMLRRGWRVIFVSDSGAGKSWLTSQIAVAAGQGIHPFGFRQHSPVNTLIVDAENPEEALDERLSRMLGVAQRKLGLEYRQHGCWVWSKMGGLNLRSRTDRGSLEAVLHHVRPSLVVLGPLYKAFRKRPNEDHEDAALDVQNVLDDLRVRHGFALVIEAHAPHGELRVRGSTAWGNWPEFGFGLRPKPNGDFEVERFRGDRVQAWWPSAYTRGPAGGWPWAGAWDSNDWQQVFDGEGIL